MSETATTPDIVTLRPEDHFVLGQEQFGAPGLAAIESIGPYVGVKALGPLLAIHDSTIDPGLGIPHHSHRRNERLFYIETGELDHSDTRNDITGHLDAGDTGIFTEGQGGMLHSEWNNSDVPARMYILVYSTDPIPEDTSFTPLRAAETPAYEEAPGAKTREVVGPASPLKLHGDIRSFTDTTLNDGAAVQLELASKEGGVISVREGAVHMEGKSLETGTTALLPPQEGDRSYTLRAEGPARIIRTITGPGAGFRSG
jgi:redox-sensitive bicupin YhaK (pirin superfamily)